MKLDNRLPLPALAFRQFAEDGRLDCVVAVRGTFVHRQDEAAAPAVRMEPFQYEDVYAGDPHETCLVRQTDLTPGKPGTDVTFLGSSFAPGGEPLPSWTCGLRVGTVRKELRVTGPRQWVPQTKHTWKRLIDRDPKPVLIGWQLSEPEPAREVRLGWDKAFGGPLPAADGETPDAHRDNPLGPGLLDLSLGDAEQSVPAHQIEDPERPIMDWHERDARPEGFGLVSPWWRHRQRHAGTYDETWLAERHPLLPHDFDPRFWQSAHPDLVATPHLRGDEAYELTNLHPSEPTMVGRLPDIALAVLCEGGDRTSEGWHVLALDGVHFDFRDGAERVMLTWRGRFPLNKPERARLTLRRVRLAEPAKHPVEEAAS